MEVINTAPTTDEFTDLSAHQSQTPPSFYIGPPVLYHHSTNAALILFSLDLRKAPALSALENLANLRTNGSTTNGNGEEHEHDIVIEGLDIWVTSERFILYSPSKGAGVSIPYPSISLHAIQRLQQHGFLLASISRDANEEIQGLFMQILTSDGFDDHDEDGTISMTIVPYAAIADSPTAPPVADTQPLNIAEPSSAIGAAHDRSSPIDGASRAIQPPQTSIQILFTAVSACANLHPDPISPGSDFADGTQDHENANDNEANSTDYTGLPPPLPGSGGWITAENMNEYFDEEGNWRSGGLGHGAGTVRGREAEEMDEGDEGDEGDAVGDAADNRGLNGEETKWRRTE